MREKALASAATFTVLGFGLLFVLSAIKPVYSVNPTTTTTVIGWLIPDGSHWNTGIGALLYPLAGVGLFAGIAKVIGLEGEFGVTLILAGITIGAVLAMLSINASSTNLVPFALVLVPGADLLIWMWKGQG